MIIGKCMNPYKDKLKEIIKGRIGIFIDAANLEHSVRDMWVNPKDVPESLQHLTADTLKWKVDYRALRDFWTGLGEVWDFRFYSADFGSEGHRKFLYFLEKGAGYTLITKPLKEYGDHTPEAPHRKANFDVEIAVDATFNTDRFETLVLFSGDCDFEYLLRSLRGRGKRAIVFSRTGHVAKELPPAASQYFDIVDFRNEFLKVESLAKNPASFDTGPRS